jgi:capsular exopolysaccharide synthesis family protein
VAIIAIGLIGAGAAYAYASTLQVLYKSTSSVYVSSQRGETTSEILQGSTFTQAQVQSYAALAPLPIVLDPVIRDLGLDVTAQELASTITADIRLNTVIIDVTVTNPSPERAAAIADAVTAELAQQAEQLESRPPGEAGGQAISPVTMTTVASAQVDDSAFAPNTRFIVLSGLLLGLALAVAGAIGLEVFDTRIRTPRDIERVGPHAFLGVMARRKKSSGQIVMVSDSYSPAAEDFRRIGTNVDFADIDTPIRSLVVTSSSQAEGKSSTSVNLALAMAERFQRVLLVDADLRKPSIASYCQIEGAVGLTSVLVGSATLEQAIRPWAEGVIDILPAGIVPPNPSQMLGTEAMADLVRRLIEDYDFVIIDSPPLLPVTDALTIAKLTDGALVIARFKSTRRQQLAQALESLQAVNARIIGTALNGVLRKGEDAYYGYVPVDVAAESTAVDTVKEGPADVDDAPDKLGTEGVLEISDPDAEDAGAIDDRGTDDRSTDDRSTDDRSTDDTNDDTDTADDNDDDTDGDDRIAPPKKVPAGSRQPGVKRYAALSARTAHIASDPASTAG